MKKRVSVEILVLSLVLSGCFGATKDTAMDGRLNEDGLRPFTDAYIEYIGPNEKWAGPKSLLVHLSAKGGKYGEVVVSHPSFKIPEGKHLIPIEDARQQLVKLQSALNSDEKHGLACSAPVRVRLVRDDGAVIEKDGCRAQEAWSRAASEMTYHWIDVAITPTQVEGPH